MNPAVSVALVVALMLLSAYGDSRGFIWADRSWASGGPIWAAIFRSYLGYATGGTAYIVGLRYLKNVTTIATSTQTTGWFLLTILGVAVAEGDFISWSLVDKSLALICIISFSLLILRTAG